MPKEKKPEIDVLEEAKLRWPDGWERTRIQDRKGNPAWKKPRGVYKEMLIRELARMGVTSMLITQSNNERLDSGVAVWFSRKKVDYSWQAMLGLDTPAPTLQEIDDAYRAKAKQYHPDSGENGGDIEIFKSLGDARKQARNWVLGTHEDAHGYAVACDRFTEARLNMAALRLAFAAFRQLDRVGVPAILERTLERTFKQALTPGSAS